MITVIRVIILRQLNYRQVLGGMDISTTRNRKRNNHGVHYLVVFTSEVRTVTAKSPFIVHQEVILILLSSIQVL